MSMRPDEMLSLAGFGPLGVVWILLIYRILVLLYYPKTGTGVPFFHIASCKTSKIRLLNLVGSSSSDEHRTDH